MGNSASENESIPDPMWVGRDGKITHPNSPSGSGGPGRFKSAGVIGANNSDSSELPNPLAPSAKSGPSAYPNPLLVPTPPQRRVNPPPRTVEMTQRISVPKGLDSHISVQFKVLADGNITDPGVHGKTTCSFTGVGFTTPAYATEKKDGSVVISKLKGTWSVNGSVIIQTVYGPDAKPRQISTYGRGTTDSDKQNGDVTLGFHESCHREDYIEYLRTHPLPVFGGKSGMTEEAFTNEVAKFKKSFDDWTGGADPFSENKTDEVGYKKSEFDANGPRNP